VQKAHLLSILKRNKRVNIKPIKKNPAGEGKMEKGKVTKNKANKKNKNKNKNKNSKKKPNKIVRFLLIQHAKCLAISGNFL
jgi:hypothetical protein